MLSAVQNRNSTNSNKLDSKHERPLKVMFNEAMWFRMIDYDFTALRMYLE